MAHSILDPIKYFVKNYPVRALLVTGSFLISSIAEGLGILALLPLLGFVLKEQTVTDSKINDLFVSVFSTFHIDVTLLSIVLFIVLFIIIKSATKLFAMYVVCTSASEITAGFRSRIVQNIMRAQWSYFTEKPAGHLSTAINEEASKAANAMVKQSNLISDLIQVVIYLGIAAYISWWITASALLLGVFGTFLLGNVFRLARRAGQEQTNSQKDLMANILDSFRIMKPVRAMARECFLTPFMDQNINKLKRSYKWFLFSPHLVEQSNEIIKVLSLGGGLYVLVGLWQIETENLFILAVLFLRILQRVNVLQKSYIVLTSMIPSFWYTRETIESAQQAKECWTGTKTPHFNREISFENVNYSHADNPVLTKASFSIEKNTLTFITGASGAGKSTLVDLICGLYSVDSGKILIDQTDIRDLSIRQWREKVGYVPQDAVLLNDTIRNNITLYDDKIDDDRIYETLKKVGAYDFVQQNRNGLDFIVGEGGGRLSGGQKQRLVIARALIRDPALLILDEATTGLDEQTENAIFTHLKTLKNSYTILAISHNPQLQQYADEVYEMYNSIIEKK